MAKTQRFFDKLSSADHMPWEKKNPGYIFQAKPLVINASPEKVWFDVRDPNTYYQHSQGAIWAHVNGPVEVNASISFKIFKDKLIGKFIPQSYERICAVNDSKKIIGWKRVLPLGLGTTERFQVLEPSEDGQSTNSYIALRVPGLVGFFTNCFLRGTIESSFNELNNGIKQSAEHS
ncbi:MAG: hypothetical protein EPN84_07200 [Legionella sp.]|nr:MAG: hypothetical protein EPN84_07200 [Legionella sp.]